MVMASCAEMSREIYLRMKTKRRNVVQPATHL